MATSIRRLIRRVSIDIWKAIIAIGFQCVTVHCVGVIFQLSFCCCHFIGVTGSLFGFVVIFISVTGWLFTDIVGDMRVRAYSISFALLSHFCIHSNSRCSDSAHSSKLLLQSWKGTGNFLCRFWIYSFVWFVRTMTLPYFYCIPSFLNTFFC